MSAALALTATLAFAAGSQAGTTKLVRDITAGPAGTDTVEGVAYKGKH